MKYTLKEVIQQFDPDDLNKNRYLSSWMRNCSGIWEGDWIPIYGFCKTTTQFQYILDATINSERSVREIAIKSLQEEYGNSEGTF